MNESSLSDSALAELLSLTMEVSCSGTIRYRNHLGQMHRVYGPAVIRTNGDQEWRQNGQLHREDGAAVIYSNGLQRWFLNCKELTQYEFNEQLQSLR